MLSIDTTPNGAYIYLNDKMQMPSYTKGIFTTPEKIKSLMPGEYNLQLEKDGYWPVKKRVRIESGQTTFIEDITLFKIESPLKLSSLSTKTIGISPDNRHLYIADENKMLNLRNNEEISLGLGQQEIQWLKGGDKLLINGEVVSLTGDNNNTNYKEILGLETHNWFLDETRNYLYYQNKNTINYFDINNKSNVVIVSNEKYLDYIPYNDSLFTITERGERKYLTEYSLQNKEIKTEIELPASADYKIRDNIQGWLSVYDGKNQSLYLFNPQQTENKEVINNIKNWQWINRYQLIYSNDFEIYLLDLRSNNSTLITRMGEEIQSIMYNEKYNYLVFSTNQHLNVIDLRTDNITTIFTAEDIQSPVLDKKTNTLYFSAKIDEEIGIYSILVK